MKRPALTKTPFGGVPKSTTTGHGKGSIEEMLPSRHALAELVKGDPSQRTIGNYGRLTPIGSGAPNEYELSIMNEKKGL